MVLELTNPKPHPTVLGQTCDKPSSQPCTDPGSAEGFSPDCQNFPRNCPLFCLMKTDSRIKRPSLGSPNLQTQIWHFPFISGSPGGGATYHHRATRHFASDQRRRTPPDAEMRNLRHQRENTRVTRFIRVQDFECKPPFLVRMEISKLSI